MTLLCGALRSLYAALPALGIVMWLLAPSLAAARSQPRPCEATAQVSRGPPPGPAPARVLESDAAELLDPTEEDGDEHDADARATGAEISARRELPRLLHSDASRRDARAVPLSGGASIRGPPRRRGPSTHERRVRPSASCPSGHVPSFTRCAVAAAVVSPRAPRS